MEPTVASGCPVLGVEAETAEVHVFILDSLPPWTAEVPVSLDSGTTGVSVDLLARVLSDPETEGVSTLLVLAAGFTGCSLVGFAVCIAGLEPPLESWSLKLLRHDCTCSYGRVGS